METLTPQQLALDAQVEYNKGKYLSAAQAFKAAADGFSALGDRLSAAEMANNSSVAYLKGDEANSALEAVLGTDAEFAAIGDLKRQAMALGNQASALEELKRLDEAIQVYEQSAQLLSQAGEYELRAYVYQSLSALLMKRGRFLEAYGIMRAGIMGVKSPNLSQRLVKTLMNIPFKFLR